MEEKATISAKTGKRSRNEPKIFNDPIWGPIKLHPVCVKIIDTPEFQRLRYVKQLGGCSFVYPGACHTRFEHSIGTSYLAGLLVRTLKENMNPAYKITIDEKDILCVEIAGLCHDLGHGPFSHLFDMMFIPRIGENPGWKHEKASIDMLDRIFETLERRGEHIGLNSSERTFIKGLIYGKKKVAKGPKTRIKNKKDFLYEIVANEENKIDVDKWDYFSRDCHMLGLNHNFQIMRSVMLARVIKHDEVYHISFPKTEYMNIFDMYHARYTLHRRAYQHPVNKAVELMITDALVLANDNLKYRVEDRTDGIKLSDTIGNMDAYTLVTDGVIDRIRFENFKDTKFKKAKKIIDRIFTRDLYKCEKKNGMERRAKETEEARKGKSGEDEDKINELIENGNIYVEPVVFNYGAGGKNPMGKVYFYSAGASVKPDDDEIFQQKSAMLPKEFEETYLRMYWIKEGKEGKGKEVKEEAIERFKKLNEITLKGKRYIFEPIKQQDVKQQETGR